MATVPVTVCFRELLRSVCECFSLDLSIYTTVEEDAEGLVRIYVDVEYFDENAELQSVTCLGGPCVSADQAEEDAAHRALKKLRDVFSFEVEDFNFEDKKYFDNLYTCVSTDYSVLRKKFKHLKTDYNLLRRYYNDLLIEKGRRSNAAASRQNISATSLRDIPAVPHGFEI